MIPLNDIECKGIKNSALVQVRNSDIDQKLRKTLHFLLFVDLSTPFAGSHTGFSGEDTSEDGRR